MLWKLPCRTSGSGCDRAVGNWMSLVPEDLPWGVLLDVTVSSYETCTFGYHLSSSFKLFSRGSFSRLTQTAGTCSKDKVVPPLVPHLAAALPTAAPKMPLQLKSVCPRASSYVSCVFFQRALMSCLMPWSSLSLSLAIGW